LGPSNKEKNSRFPNEIELERFHIFDAAPGQVGGFLAGESGKIVFIDQADLYPFARKRGCRYGAVNPAPDE
jgi:hypothetical protein